MSYSFATFSSGSPITGKFTAEPVTSSMSFAHLPWFSTGSTLRPITLAPRAANCFSSAPTAPSSVVQTGVKSFGCENSTAQLSPIHSWKWIVPCVVSAVKSGATSLMRSDISFILSCRCFQNVWGESLLAHTKKPTRLVGSWWVPRYSNRKVTCYDSLMRTPTPGDSNSSRTWGSNSASSSWLIFLAAASLAGLEQFAPLRST